MAAETAADNSDERELVRRPLVFALGMCVGASLYYVLPFEPRTASILVASALVIAAGFFLMRRIQLPRQLRSLVTLVAGIAAAMAVAKMHTLARPAPPLADAIGPAMVEGWISDIEPGSNGNRLNIRVHAISDTPTSPLPERIRLTHSNRLEVETGRFVRCYAVIRPPPQPELPGDYPFNRQAYFEGLDGVGYVLGRCRGGTLGAPGDLAARLEARIGEIRRSLARHVNRAAGERAGGFAAALTSGDRSFMAQSDMEALRNSGLAHLLAISGLHLGIVGSLAFLGLKRSLALWEWFAVRVPPQKPAAVGGLIATAVYLVLSGASVSTQRAFIMAAVVFLALLLDRSPLSFRTFALAMIAVILLQPSAVMTPGFQMSFAATGALIATYEAWSRRQAETGTRRRGIGFVLKSLAVTSVIGAAATAPFALYHFDRVAPLGLAANLLAMPIVTFISAPAAGLALVTAPFGGGDIFLRLFGWSLERILAIAHWAADAGSDGMRLGTKMPGLVIALLAIGVTGACLASGVRNRFMAALAALASGILVWWLSPQTALHVSRSGDVYVGTADGMERFAFVKGQGLAPLAYVDLPFARDCGVSGCRVAGLAGEVLIGRTDWIVANCDRQTAVTISVGPPANRCEGLIAAITWRDVETAGAFTILRSPNGALSTVRPICGHRPWAPCLGEADTGPD